MAPTYKHRSLDAFDRMSPDDEDAVVAQALVLQRAALAGSTQPLLRGKNFGLLCDGADDAGDASLFRRAATELGAHVAHIRASLTDSSTPQEVQHTARMLGRLYDAVECQGLAPDLVQQVGHAVDVPVYDGVASPQHPTARLASRLSEESSAQDRRRFVVQAVLLSSMA